LGKSAKVSIFAKCIAIINIILCTVGGESTNRLHDLHFSIVAKFHFSLNLNYLDLFAIVLKVSDNASRTSDDESCQSSQRW
jgi:hypothetical protein